jgi:hypothetical protein
MYDYEDDWCYACCNYGRPRIKWKDPNLKEGEQKSRIKGYRGGRRVLQNYHRALEAAKASGRQSEFLFWNWDRKPRNRAEDIVWVELHPIL